MSPASSTWSSRLADWLVRRRWQLMFLTIVLLVVGAIPASRVRMDRTISTMFAETNPIMPPFRRLERTFRGNEIVLAVYEDPELFSETGLERVATIQSRLAKVPGVKGVLSVDKLMGERILDPDMGNAARVKAMFQDFTHGANGTTSAIACMLYPIAEAEVDRHTTIQQLRGIITALPDGLAPGTLAGEPAMIDDAFAYMDRDGQRLFTTTTILLALVILGCFRSLRWVCIPMAIVQAALMFTNATLGSLQFELTMVSSTLTAVVTVIGVATVVHFIVRFREFRRQGMSSEDSLRQAISLLAVPIFWACVTDAVGFGALMFADVGPVSDFGLMMALGSLMVLISVPLLLPCLALIGRRSSDPQVAWGEEVLDAKLLNLVSMVDRSPWLVGATLLSLSLLAIYGIRWVEVETDFTRNFRDSTPIVKSYELVESKLGGAGVMDVVVPAPETLTWEYLRRVLVLERDLKKRVLVRDPEGNEQPGLTKAISVADAILSFSPKHPDRIRWRRFRNSLVTSELATMRKKLPEFYDALHGLDPSNGQHYLRVMLRSKERQPSEQKQQIISQTAAITQEHFPKAEVTGYFTLLTGLIDSMLADQWKTFGIALVGIFITMTIAFRDLRLALIATLPNAMPILVVSGLMGWLGIKVNMGAAMIAAVSMGLSIDSSVHYLLAYRRARQSGMSVNHALAEVQQTVGRAMVFSTLALIIGFAAMVISEFVPTIYFGSLVSISMLGALMGNLVGLPLLLRMFDRCHTLASSPSNLTVAAQKGSY